MPPVVTMAPVNVAREYERVIGRDVWRYRVYPMQETAEAVLTFLDSHGFPSRIPMEKIGHAVFLLNQAGYQVEFQPLPERK